MRFLRNHWFYVGGILFVGLAFFLGWFGGDLPIGIYYLWYIRTEAAVEPWHWWVGVGALPLAFFFIIHLPIRLLRDKASPYAWSQEEMNRFRVAEKLRKR